MNHAEKMKNTLRYKNMVANLRSRPNYTKEAALLKEIAGGKQWRIDAVMEAINTDLKDWNYIDRTAVFEQAAMFGRLSTIEQLARNPFFNFEEKKFGGAGCPTQILAAFDKAVIHGHYKIAEYCASLGATPGYMFDHKEPRAMYVAMEEGDTQKMDFLIKCGAEPKHYLSTAVAHGNKAVVDYLVSKGADVNFASDRCTPPFEIAVRFGRNEMAHYLLSKGADPKKGNAILSAIGNNNTEMVETMLKLGVETSEYAMQIAKNKGHQDMIDLLEKYTNPKTPGSSSPKP